MTYLLLGVALLGLVLLLVRAIVATSPATLAQILRWSLISLGVILALLLLVRGQTALAAIPAGIAAIAWRVFRAVPLSGWFGLWQLGRLWRQAQAQHRTSYGPYRSPGGAGGAGAGAGTASEVATGWLRMHLDHASGDVSGEVLRGPFAGRSLDSLSEHDAFVFHQMLRAEDPRSLQLFETYLDRAHGDEWRDSFERQERHARAQRAGHSAMSREEALAILGLDEGVDETAIKEAHRKLMQKNHPDRGGSDYLAAKINEAKDVLMSPSGRAG